MGDEVAFRTFESWEQKVIKVKVHTIWQWPWQEPKGEAEIEVPVYESLDDVRKAACAFADGKDVISITESMQDNYMIVTVYYWKNKE